MTSSYGDTVLDFDLNFLRPTPNTTVVHSRLDKQRKAILIVKKKTIATDSLIKKYYAKRDVLDQTEKNLLASKEECKQICIDYRKALETCSKLENDIQVLQNSNKELETKYFNAENQFGAVKSHANQLQVLVKEHETQIEALNIESKLSKSNAKDYEKKASSLQKENEELINHICLVRDVIFGKKKLSKKHKLLLQKYDKYKSKDIDDSMSLEEDSENENDLFEDAPMSPFCEEDSEKNYEKALKSPTACENLQLTNTGIDKISTRSISKRDESEYINDIVSVDTGRGSSLEFSDSDKCFHSPDYFNNDSPLSELSLANKQKIKLVSIATSPIPVYQTVQIATSPIVFEDDTQTHTEFAENMEVCASANLFNMISKNPVNMIDRALSPIQLNVTTEFSTSPIRNFTMEIATSPIKICKRTDKDLQNNKCEKTQQEQECLELNNSNNICGDNGNDCEIEMILNTMRMHQELITPIPATPARSRCAETVKVSSVTSKLNEYSEDYVCQDAALVREDNKKLHASIAELAKEIVSIKSMLMNKVPPITAQVQNEDSNLNYESCTEENDLIIIDPNQNIIPTVHHSNHSEPNKTKNMLELADKLKQEQTQGNPQSDQNMQVSSVPSPVPNEIICDDAAIPSVNEKHSCSIDRLHFEDLALSPNEYDSEIGELREVRDDVEKVLECSNNNLQMANHDKLIKSKKLSRLGKLKQKMLPKCKIRRVQALSAKRLRMKPKQLVFPKKKRVTEADSSATLNDKNIYEKALKVMADLKSKKNCEGNIETNQNSGKNPTIKCISQESENTVETEDQKNYLHISTIDDQTSNSSQNISITTRSRSKCNVLIDANTTLTDSDKDIQDIATSEPIKTKKNSKREPSLQEIRIRLKRASIDASEVPRKRMLRSSTIRQLPTDENTKEKSTIQDTTSLDIDNDEAESPNDQCASVAVSNVQARDDKKVSTHCDDNKESAAQPEKCVISDTRHVTNSPKDSILCVMIEKYGVQSVNYSAKKISDSVTNMIAKKIEDHIAKIIELPPNETKDGMNHFVEELQNTNLKSFLAGLMKYLKDPGRKTELFSKAAAPPAPPMTKSEQVLLYVVTQLQTCWPSADVVNKVLSNIEYTLFALNRSPQFDVIESMSHFYAIICRYFRMKSRLRLFIMDAMYCLQFKSVPLIKQCMDVWMHILPLAHMGIAKSPLVTCLVYLLHFYKCEDRFNRVQDIRNILSRKYFYQITEWNETRILEMFRNSIKELRGIPVERKMLRMALIIIAKRQGPRWCQNNIIKNLLQPIIEKDNVSDSVKEFCVSMLGPLLKPYPVDMKVHCEIVMNQLIDMLEQNPSHNLAEAIVKSLIFMNRHNQNRVIQALIGWRTQHTSHELEELLRDFVKSKPVKAWINTLSRVTQYK